VIAFRPLPELEPAPEGVITLAELKECMCHWPIGDPKEEGFHFCGRRKSFGVPYCAHHAAIAYNPAARRRRSA
jgi:GcrA cell cycle regulator